MKRKSPTCSTGHGTGRKMPLTLRNRLERDRLQRSAKRGRRRGVGDIHGRWMAALGMPAVAV